MTKEEHKQLCKQFWDYLDKEGELDSEYHSTFETNYEEFVNQVDRRVWKEGTRSYFWSLVQTFCYPKVDPDNTSNNNWSSFVSYSGKMSLIFHIVNPIRRNHFEVVL